MRHLKSKDSSVSWQLWTCTYYWHQAYQISAVCIWRINGTGVPKFPFTSHDRRCGLSHHFLSCSQLLRRFVVASLTISYPPSSYCLFQRIAEQNCQVHETDFTLLAVGCSLNVKYNELKSYTYALSVWWISLLFYLLFVARLTLAWFFNSLHMAHD